MDSSVEYHGEYAAGKVHLAEFKPLQRRAINREFKISQRTTTTRMRWPYDDVKKQKNPRCRSSRRSNVHLYRPRCELWKLNATKTQTTMQTYGNMSNGIVADNPDNRKPACRRSAKLSPIVCAESLEYQHTNTNGGFLSEHPYLLLISTH